MPVQRGEAGGRPGAGAAEGGGSGLQLTATDQGLQQQRLIGGGLPGRQEGHPRRVVLEPDPAAGEQAGGSHPRGGEQRPAPPLRHGGCRTTVVPRMRPIMARRLPVHATGATRRYSGAARPSRALTRHAPYSRRAGKAGGS